MVTIVIMLHEEELQSGCMKLRQSIMGNLDCKERHEIIFAVSEGHL